MELPPGKKALHNNLVYHTKNETTSVKRYKVRPIVKGFEQCEGVDYTKIFMHVVKLFMIQLVLSIMVAKDPHLE